MRQASESSFGLLIIPEFWIFYAICVIVLFCFNLGWLFPPLKTIKRSKQTKLSVPLRNRWKVQQLLSSWSRWLSVLWLQYPVLVSGRVLSQFLMFSGYFYFSIHDVYPVHSRDAIAQSSLNQFKASNMQPNTAWPASSRAAWGPLELCSHTLGLWA